jgi:hypothetical protein
MAAAFTTALARVRDGSADILSSERLDQLARAAELRFRDRMLTPGDTLRLFARQIAHGNVACAAVRHLAGQDLSDSAWCAARSRLPMQLITDVNRLVVQGTLAELDQCDDAGDGQYRWRGHRVFVVDATNDSMPDTPVLRAHYGVPAGVRPGLGFAMSHLLMLMDHASGLIVRCIDSPMFSGSRRGGAAGAF